MNSSQLCIGKKVRVLRTLSFSYQDKERVYYTSPADFDAYIVGASVRPLGTYVPASGGYLEDYEPAYLRVKSTIKVYHVRKRLFGREYLVLLEDLHEHSDSMDEGDRAGRPAQEQGGDLLCNDGPGHRDNGQG